MKLDYINRRIFISNTMKVGLGVTAFPFIETLNNETYLNIKVAGNVPCYLRDYEYLYKTDPKSAALKWFRDAKFGMFIHFGLVSLFPTGVDGFALAEQSLNGTNVSLEELLMKRFRAEKFNADSIVQLAVDSGMRYINFTTHHLGNLRMWNTMETEFNSMKSAAGRDFVAEMATACSKKKIGLFLYVPRLRSITEGENFKNNKLVLTELLSNYGPIAGIWFDGIGDYYQNREKSTRLSELYAYVRFIQPQCLISFKQGATGEEDFSAPEHVLKAHSLEDESGRKIFEEMSSSKPSEICTTILENVEYQYQGIRYRQVKWFDDIRSRHKNADEVIEMLKGAKTSSSNLLLNFGPLGDGSIHPEDIVTLREVGSRLKKIGLK